MKKKDLEHISLKNSIPLHIPKRIESQIEFLCRKIDKVEWSGVLFYSVKGSIKNFSKVELTVEDIYPMDKGNAGSTGYDLNEDLIDYRMSNPKSLAWKVGMVHSHHSMDAYFSGTDMSELNDNSEFHNYYLSVVVNNRGKIVAKVAIRGANSGYTCKDERGKNFQLNLDESKEVMFTFDCKVMTLHPHIEVEEEFEKRVDKVIKDSEKRVFTVKEQYNKISKNMQTQKSKGHLPHIEEYMRKSSKNPFNKFDDFDSWNFNKSFQQPIEQEIEGDPIIEDFVRMSLRLGVEMEDPDLDSIQNALEDLEASNINQFDYSAKYINKYPNLFESYFSDIMEINEETFTSTTEDVMSILQEYEDMGYTILNALSVNIGVMLDNSQKMFRP